MGPHDDMEPYVIRRNSCGYSWQCVYCKKLQTSIAHLGQALKSANRHIREEHPNA